MVKMLKKQVTVDGKTKDAYYAVKGTKSVLYKYQSWTQPAMTSDRTKVDGVWYSTYASHVHSDSYRPWKAFDGLNTANNGWWTANIDVTASNPAWICLECDHKLKLTSVVLKADTSGPENPKQGTVQVSNNGINWKDVGSFSFANNGTGISVTCAITVSEGYHFYRIHCTDEWADGIVFGEIIFSGQIAKQVTSGSYDFSETKTIYKTRGT